MSSLDSRKGFSQPQQQPCQLPLESSGTVKWRIGGAANCEAGLHAMQSPDLAALSCIRMSAAHAPDFARASGSLYFPQDMGLTQPATHQADIVILSQACSVRGWHAVGLNSRLASAHDPKLKHESVEACQAKQ